MKAIKPTIKELQKEVARLKRMVHHDPLTGLYNRAGFHEDVVGYLGELEAARRRGSRDRRSLQIGNLSIVFIDLNDLKKFNDRFGHVYGDKAIMALAKSLKRGIRNIDIPCRWSGDEFVVALIGVDKDDAERVVAKIKQAISKTVFKDKRGNHARLSFSFGISSALDEDRKPKFVSDFDRLVNEADAKMYEHKKYQKSLVKELRALI